MLAQQPAPTLPTFSESVEVRVLNLDVDVTDAKGNPVTDLKKDDFILKIGGKAVPIDYFTLVNEGTIHAPDLATAAPEQVLATYRQGEDAYVPRNFLVYVDLGYLPPGSATAASTRFATSPRASGRTMRCASSSSTGFRRSWSTGRRARTSF